MAVRIPPFQSESFGVFMTTKTPKNGSGKENRNQNDAPVTSLCNPCEHCVILTFSLPQNLLICCLPLSDSALMMEAKVRWGNFVALACLLHS